MSKNLFTFNLKFLLKSHKNSKGKGSEILNIFEAFTEGANLTQLRRAEKLFHNLALMQEKHSRPYFVEKF